MHATKKLLLLTTCALCIAAVQTARADYLGLEVVERSDLEICRDQTQPDLPFKLEICDVYVVYDSPDDRLISTALCDVSTTDPAGFFQHPANPTNRAPGCSQITDPPPFGFPTLVCDSFITIGLECNPLDDRTATDPDFDSTGFNTSGEVSGGWFNTAPSNSQGAPDANGRVMIARFSYKQNKNTSGNACVFSKLAGSGEIVEFPLQPFDCSVPGMQAGTGGGGGGGGGPPAGGPDPACGPGAGNCYVANGSPGCDCIPCCDEVCNAAPDYCCDENKGWDGLCAFLAGELCPDVNKDDIPDSCQVCPGEGNCCTANGTPGCSDADCCSIVCGIDSSCCDAEWTQACANLANQHCHSFLDCCCTRAGGFCMADIDGGGDVGPFDLALLLGNWGADPANPCVDLDDNGEVGAFDLALLLGNWGPCDCFSPCTATPELFCDNEYRQTLDGLNPQLQPALCRALTVAGQSERCPDPPDPDNPFYVEMHFSTPTLVYELGDGGSSIAIQIDPLDCRMTILVDGIPFSTIELEQPECFDLLLPASGLMDVVTTIQEAVKWLKFLNMLSDPCFMWSLLDTMADIYSQNEAKRVLACDLYMCFMAQFLVNNGCYQNLIIFFSTFTCSYILQNLDLLYDANQQVIIRGTLVTIRDQLGFQICGILCNPCSSLPCEAGDCNP